MLRSLAWGSGFKTQIKEVQTKHSNPIKCLKSGRKHLQHFKAKKISFPKTYNFLTENENTLQKENVKGKMKKKMTQESVFNTKLVI